MLFENPEDDARFRKAIHMLADLTDSDAELTLLVTFIRTFFEVKQERREKNRRNKVVKLQSVDN